MNISLQKKKQNITETGHFLVCHFMLIVVGVLYAVIFFPDLEYLSEKNMDQSQLAQGEKQSLIVANESSGNNSVYLLYSDKIEEIKKIEKIQSLLSKEMLIKRNIAGKISASIHTYTKGKDILPELVIAIMKIESHGIPDAVSSAGAMGLMQVMPFWKKVMKMEKADLFDIDTNVKMGVYVLQKYLKRYKTLKRALAAYNGSLGSNKYPKKVLKVYERMMTRNNLEI